ncbi:molybdenum cofactor guanylyltransferase [Agromyces sp. Marseille-P2726]|uniref:molybdenum cofactor guanylyltransferase n=1 Tax=Agromyces sp. Marseille-P2726 TaxID=2709132 RepID=UPI0015710032|nr:NTP transferase domain-containing protein [Agromyces sp. Marseille-P2726]
MNPAGAPGPLDAIILAGGRAERLGGASKPDLVVGGRSLLSIAIDAARTVGCARIIVVGPSELDAPGCTVVREDPPFGGPVAAVAAGLAALGVPGGRVAPGEAGRVSRPGDPDLDPRRAARGATRSPNDDVLVLARDMPDAHDATRRLGEARSEASVGDGVCLVDADGNTQWLAAIYSRSSLERSLDVLELERGVTGASMRRLAASLDLTLVADGGSTHDIDTWSDLERARSTEQEAAQ